MLSQIAASDDLVFFRPHQFLVRDNERPEALYDILEGWACRHRLLPDGRRQITALYLPGDLCDPLWSLSPYSHDAVVALTNVRAVRRPLNEAAGSDRGKATALRLVESVERQSNWLVSLGRKTAMERLAQLLLELFERMRRAGLAYGQQCALPLTQTDIADATGLTAVHVNRTLQAMRAKGVLDLHSKWLRIPDLSALRDLAALGHQDSL
ncbi:Crp/Fnr family transcriptional regulator [Sphingobium lactosutens]|uniref:Crp/Fnr family transcriptional regulator n=1 Tax=Sphingobium lactosutens DS20 TaxID=1331060 RepID=T0H8P0_9SPHN|nr:helix-turn-helix domain-containing protein [Sphingobium lactosutens]EQB12721.1 Crp/Fnr family transcriptional regulator [Sphingobium lactosutens DS20]